MTPDLKRSKTSKVKTSHPSWFQRKTVQNIQSLNVLKVDRISTSSKRFLNKQPKKNIRSNLKDGFPNELYFEHNYQV